MPRTFTLDEANALLPVLESLLRSAIASKERLQQTQEQIQQLRHRVLLSGGTLFKISDLAARQKETDEAAQQLRDTLAEIEAMGVQVKDLDIGLLDFPCAREGEIVLLCWKLGEASITHWHTPEEGFKGRKPIDEQITGYRKHPS